ncbi:hypothetical protein HK099_000194, partial [Clydaea vesicula]
MLSTHNQPNNDPEYTEFLGYLLDLHNCDYGLDDPTSVIKVSFMDHLLRQPNHVQILNPINRQRLEVERERQLLLKRLKNLEFKDNVLKNQEDSIKKLLARREIVKKRKFENHLTHQRQLFNELNEFIHFLHNHEPEEEGMSKEELDNVLEEKKILNEAKKNQIGVLNSNVLHQEFLKYLKNLNGEIYDDENEEALLERIERPRDIPHEKMLDELKFFQEKARRLEEIREKRQKGFKKNEELAKKQNLKKEELDDMCREYEKKQLHYDILARNAKEKISVEKDDNIKEKYVNNLKEAELLRDGMEKKIEKIIQAEKEINKNIGFEKKEKAEFGLGDNEHPENVGNNSRKAPVEKFDNQNEDGEVVNKNHDDAVQLLKDNEKESVDQEEILKNINLLNKINYQLKELSFTEKILNGIINSKNLDKVESTSILKLEEDLNKILLQLDLIESFENEIIRSKRHELVEKINCKLDKIDK